MSSMFGHSVLILGIILLIILLYQSFFYNKQQKYSYQIIIQIITSIYLIAITIAFLCLLKEHLFTNLSITNVINTTHSKQPLIYKICALWGNHEGSMLLWCWILSIYTFSLLFLKKLTIELSRYAFIIQNIINLFFLLYIVLTSNPYLPILYRSIEGKELNPILQDIVLSIHPPLIYIGYLGLSIPFSLTFAYLFTRLKYTQIWLYYIRLYNLIAWCFLTFGIFLGSWWAYYELGWGGWWFWDPVENASLMPWLLSTALLHTIISTQKSLTLLKTTIFLSFFSFYSSLLGTFFVRSGLIDSVHSFASDSNRGLFILFIMIFFLFFFIYILVKNKTYFVYKNIFNIFSKEGIISLNQFYFISFYIIILIGTFYPSIYYFLYHKSITIGPSFYNQILIPITIPFFLFMILSLYLHWQNSNRSNKLFISFYELFFIIPFILGILYFIYLQDYNRFYILYLILPFLIWSLFKHLQLLKERNNNISISMLTSHFGVTIFIFAILFWYSFHQESHQILYPGEKFYLNFYEYIFKGINIIKGPNYDAFYGSFVITKNYHIVGILFPEKRHYFIQDFYASKVDIQSNFFYDIHAIIGDGNLYTGWTTSFYTYPFLSWIWIAGFFFILGAIFSIYKIILNNFQIHIKKLI
uniref:Heme lyase n=1 Tax=Reclinomonas americana ATCC 50283 TaxID=1295594 RepID=M4QAM3_RECAM|nr:heme lyase [Reclinomonas americana ATCC 50283]